MGSTHPRNHPAILKAHCISKHASAQAALKLIAQFDARAGHGKVLAEKSLRRWQDNQSATDNAASLCSHCGLHCAQKGQSSPTHIQDNFEAESKEAAKDA